MKPLIPLLTLLLLAGCATHQTTSPNVTTPTNLVPQSEAVLQETITPESLREEYESEGFIVREIVPYEGDYLVYYGNDPYGGIFQWVYTTNGLRAPLLFSDREVLSYEIIYPGCIRVLQGPTNLYNGALSFPTCQYATTALPVWADGEIPPDLSTSGSVERQIYWAPIDESHVWGWDHGQVALVDVQVTTRGVEAVFGPTADNIGGFYAAASSVPVTQTIYSETDNTLTLAFRNTSLTSGNPAEFYDMAGHESHGTDCELCGLPTTFPAGTLEGSNLFISHAEIRQVETDIYLILTLTEAARQYTAESGQLLRNESRPWMSLSFREPR